METIDVRPKISVAIRSARTNSTAVDESRPRVELEQKALAYRDV